MFLIEKIMKMLKIKKENIITVIIENDSIVTIEK